jgi:hypothetical protein
MIRALLPPLLYSSFSIISRFTVREYSLDMLKADMAMDRNQKEKERDELKVQLCFVSYTIPP